jgi:arginine exporter protein ArgO
MKQLKTVLKVLFTVFVYGAVTIILLMLTGFGREYVLNREVPVLFQMITLMGVFLIWIAWAYGLYEAMRSILSINNKNEKEEKV